jgi:hypothetical protein
MRRRRLGRGDWGAETGARRLGRGDWGAETGARRLGRGDWGTETGAAAEQSLGAAKALGLESNRLREEVRRFIEQIRAA